MFSQSKETALDWFTENNFKKSRGNFACFCNIKEFSWSEIINDHMSDDSNDHSDDISEDLRQGCEWYK